MRLFMTGPTGYIGGRLLAYLLAADPAIRVSALVRSHPSNREGGRVEYINGDITALEAGAFRDRNIDYAVHCAALMADHDDLPRSEFERVNVDGTRKLILALRECGLKQFVHISSVGVYGSTGPFPADEDTPFGERLSDYEWSKMASERAAAACCREIGVPLTILRVGLLYGDGMRYGWPEVMRTIRNRTMKIIGDGSALIQLSYIDDVIAGITRAIGNAVAYGGVFNICGEERCSIDGLFSTLATILSSPRPVKVPFAPVYGLALLLANMPDRLKAGRIRLLTPHRVRFFREHHIYSIERAKQQLNFQPRYGIHEGMSRMARAFQGSQPWVKKG